MISILEKNCVGSGRARRLSPELADAFAETWPVALRVADAPQIARRLAGVRVRNGWLDLSQPSFTGP